MKSGSYALRCSRCCFLKEWPEKYVDERETFGPAWAESHRMAYMCVHAGRRHPMRVNREDRPCNPYASDGARTCPIKAVMEKAKEES